MIRTLFSAWKSFRIPLVIFIGLVVYGVLKLYSYSEIAVVLMYFLVFLGTYEMVLDTLRSIFKRQFALDYIAILAIVVALISQQYLVAGILALMISSGSTLEAYGVAQAKKSLTQLIDRIPTDVVIWENEAPGRKEKLQNISIGDSIFVRKGEVIALDGEMLSETGETDESSLTGEPYFIEKTKGDVIRSGTINIGQPMVIRVTRTEEHSTYKKIIDMVKQAEEEKSPMVRLADKYSTMFTIITLSLGGFAYIMSGYSLDRVLAVLAIATPCPLIIATPIALLGGVNASAKKKIIVKKLSALEILSRIETLVFDKTGTITLGKPCVTKVNLSRGYTLNTVLSIAEAIERNSLHPLAKAIVHKAREVDVHPHFAKNVQEIIGKGITGDVQNKSYMLSKLDEGNGMAIRLTAGKDELAVFHFEDAIKDSSKKIISQLKGMGLELHIFTGDKKESAEKVVSQLGESVNITAEMTPEQKQKGINDLKKQQRVIGMVGDGINDAPALALADVGMAFSNNEQTAASEAADIVFLGGDFSQVYDAWRIAKRTLVIAKQSIRWGIGLSILGMLLATFGYISPLLGAGLQEAIDVTVILNALRASRDV